MKTEKKELTADDLEWQRGLNRVKERMEKAKKWDSKPYIYLNIPVKF